MAPKLGFVAGQRLGEGDARIIRRVDDDAVDEIVQFYAAVDGGEHRGAVRGRPALAPSVVADDVLVGELDAALLDFVEHEFKRHQFGEARRGNELIAVLLEQNAVALGIEHQRGRHAGLESLVLLDVHVRGGMSGSKGRGRQAARHSADRNAANKPPRQQA